MFRRRIRARAFASALVTLSAASFPIAAFASHLEYQRGPILGTTTLAIDIEVGTGISRSDQRFEMAETPPVFVLARSNAADIRVGSTVHVVFAGKDGTRLLAAVIYPNASSRYPWDARHSGVRSLSAHVVAIAKSSHGFEFSLRSGTTVRRMSLRANTPISTIRNGGRVDLAAGRAALIVASKNDVDIYGIVRAIVVSDDADVGPL